MKSGAFLQNKESSAQKTRVTDIPPEQRRHAPKRKKKSNRLNLLICILCIVLLFLIGLIFILSSNSLPVKNPQPADNYSNPDNSFNANSSFHTNDPATDDKPLSSEVSSNSTDPLIGKWDMDGVTAYEFLENGTGNLLLPSFEYAFTYVIEEETISLEFADENVKDAVYQFAVQADVLTLDGGTNTTQGTYTLKRIG